MKLSLLTATYNHPLELLVLYKTLKKQDDRDFTWIIIDDGSNEETNVVVEKMLKEKSISILYVKKNNGGKGSAINKGLDMSENFDFIAIIDDDEQLYPNAVSTIKKYYEEHKDSNCAIINFARAKHDGTPIFKMNIKGDFFASVPEFKRRGLLFDGYVGYFVNKIEGNRFPIFKNEKYIGPSVLMMLVCKKYEILWTKTVLGTTEYLDGGITHMGRKLRLLNPKGMIFHASLMQNGGVYVRLGYSLRAYAYMYYADLNKNELREEGIDMSVFYPVALCGKILSYLWKKKYPKGKI